MYATLAQKGLFLLKVFKASLLKKLKKVKNHVNSNLFFKVNQNLQTKLKFTLSQG